MESVSTTGGVAGLNEPECLQVKRKIEQNNVSCLSGGATVDFTNRSQAVFISCGGQAMTEKQNGKVDALLKAGVRVGGMGDESGGVVVWTDWSRPVEPGPEAEPGPKYAFHREVFEIAGNGRFAAVWDRVKGDLDNAEAQDMAVFLSNEEICMESFFGIGPYLTFKVVTGERDVDEFLEWALKQKENSN